MKEKKECKIVQDLLPNYVEKLTNEETNKYIEEHLTECNECKQVLENMKKDFNINNINKEKKAVRYFKKYKNKLRILKIILLIILVIFVANIARKMIIISNLSNRADNTINTTNYHRVIYSYEKDDYSKVEIFSLNDKKKLIKTNVTLDGIRTVITYANKISTDEIGMSKYSTNTYTITENEKTAKLNGNLTISVDPQNILHTSNIFELFLISATSSVSSSTYNGKECYYIATNENVFAFASKGTYINKETGLQEATIAYETEYSDGALGRWPAAEYEYEFNIVTEQDFIEPNINEYKKIEQ